MIKQETFKVLKQIADFYDKFTFDQEKVDSWHMVLKNFSYNKVKFGDPFPSINWKATARIHSIQINKKIIRRPIIYIDIINYYLYFLNIIDYWWFLDYHNKRP